MPTQPGWRDPRGIISAIMSQRWGMVRDAYTIMRYEEVFRKGLCQYGLIRAQKSG